MQAPVLASAELLPTRSGVVLLQFEMSARKVQDVILRALRFRAAQGSLTSAGHYALWADSDLDGVMDTLLQSDAPSEGGILTFHKFRGGGFLVTERTILFEVTGAFLGSAEGTLQLAFADEDSIEAEEPDGEAITGLSRNGACPSRACQISNITTPAKVFTILPQGNLFVTQGIPARSFLLLGGSQSDPVLRLIFRAQEEDIAVTDLRITSLGSLASSVDRLELFREGAASPFAEATAGGCGSADVLTEDPDDGTPIRTFCAGLGGGRFVVPEDDAVHILVRVRIRSDQTGGVSGEAVQFFLPGDPDIEAVQARGRATGRTLTVNDEDSSVEGEIFVGTNTASTNADIPGPEHTVVMAKIVSLANASADPDGSPVRAGTHILGAFRFTAAANENTANGRNTVTVDGLIFSVSATNVALDAGAFTLANTLDAGTSVSCTARDAGGTALTGTVEGAFFVECSSLGGSSIATMLSSGGSLELALTGKVTAPRVQASAVSALQVSLQQFSPPQSTFGVTTSHIRWLDEDAGGSEALHFLDLPEVEVRGTVYRL